MIAVPQQPKIYHITHLDNLAGIIACQELISDARRIASGQPCLLVGMSTIKQRRLTSIEVSCHPGTTVGQYVPFYFCPRSIMLYILHRGNHPGVSYQGGQRPMLHLQADFQRVTQWAEAQQIPWAFSSSNAGAYLSSFHNQRDQLSRIDWRAIAATDFRDLKTKEGKQAEFLIWERCPWPLIDKIGVCDQAIASAVATILDQILDNSVHRPRLDVEPSWYF